MSVLDIAILAHKAFLKLSSFDKKVKNEILNEVIKNIEHSKNLIFEANNKDLEDAKALLETKEINQSTYNRLKLDENKMRDMVAGIKDIINLEDPTSKVYFRKELDEGLVLEKIATPIGVIGVIFEARPDVILQISSLAIKSGNAVILKGGKESYHTNKILFEIVDSALDKFDFKGAVNLLYSREEVKEMLECDKYIDLIIPRGSNSLVQYIQQNTKIPILGHASGICHMYISEFADFEIAKKTTIDAKIQYPSACNATETVLVNKNFELVEEFKKALIEAGIKIVENPTRWDIEYGEKTLSFKLVNSLDEAISHINSFGSHHTDSIITNDNNEAEYFLRNVDSADVFHNVSTRFSDGFRFGFGAEVGISTNKTHARGPVGLEGLTIYKYVLRGSGQIVDDYSKGIKKFTHKTLEI